MSTTSQSTGTIAERLASELEARIAGGILQDGHPIPTERELVSEFSTSRNVVREALRLLSSRGLIETIPRHRPTVRRADVDGAFGAMNSIVTRLLGQTDGVKNLFETRILVEASLVRQAALSATKDDLDGLRRALNANGEAIGDSEAFYETDTAFHAMLFEISGNPVLPALHRAYVAWLAPQWKKMPRMPERNRANFQAHSDIFEQILMRDPDQAEQALRRHLADAWEQVRVTFQKETPK